jgi:predicted Fe-S protein YdhL (DUF1289 family)
MAWRLGIELLTSALLLAISDGGDVGKPSSESAAGTPKPHSVPGSVTRDRERDRDSTGRPGFLPPFPPGGPGASEPARRMFENLPPEKRREAIEKWRRGFDRFRKDLDRWEKLSESEKSSVLRRDEERRKRMDEAAQSVLKETGLKLDPAGEKRFKERFVEERRKIEEELFRELDEKRKPRVKTMIEGLVREFKPATQ